MREAIDRLKTENKKLNKDLVKERSRAEQALRNSNLSSANDGAVKALKDRINDLKNEIELLNNQNAKLLMALKEANQNNSSREGAHVGQGHFGGQGDYELRNKIDELSRRLDETEAENRRLKQNGPTNNGHAGYSSAFDSRKEHITRLEAENGSLKRDLSNRDLMNTSDVSAVQEENRRLKSELAVEKKLLENRVLIAEEKAKALLDQYSSTVAPNEIRNNLLRAALDDPLPNKPLASSYSSSYNREPYKYDSNKYLDSYQQETRYGEQKYISANIDLYRHEEPTRMRISQDLGPIYRPSVTPVYETRERPSYQLERSYVHSDYGVSRESFPAYNSVSYIHRPVLENDLDRSRPTTRIYEAETKPRASVSNKMKHSAFSSGEDYLSRVSQVYPTRENSLNTSSDRASLRRKAVKESSPYRSRPGETFLSQFKQKLQTINS